MSHNNCFLYMIEEIKLLQNSAKKLKFKLLIKSSDIYDL